MKKNLLKVLLTVMVITLGSCVKDKMPEALTTMNSQCPLEFTQGSISGQMDSVSYDEKAKSLTLLVSINDSVGAKGKNNDLVRNVLAMGEPLKKLCLNHVKDVPDFVQLLQVASEKGVNLRLRVTGKVSEKGAELPVDAAEAKSLFDKTFQINQSEEILKAFVNSANSMLPRTEGDITINGISLSNDYVECNTTLNERKVPLKTLCSVANQYKPTLIKELGSAKDPNGILAACINAERGFKYVFHGDRSGTSCEVTFTVDELKKLR